jgi:hypothetical protein
VLAATFAALLSAAQRILSTPVRDVRRRVRAVAGTIEWKDGSTTAIEPRTLTWAPELALKVLTVAVAALAVALVLVRVT